MGQRPIIHLNQAELLRRRQALIRQGQKIAFTYAVKPAPEIKRSNTPSGARKPSAKFLKSYDAKQKAAERSVRIQTRLEDIIPHDILLAHAVRVKRAHMGLSRDKLVRDIPTLDKPKALHHRVERKAPEGLTLHEKKLWKNMKWYKPDEF